MTPNEPHNDEDPHLWLPGPAVPHWVTVDLGDQHEVNRIGFRIKDVQVRTSLDGEHWSDYILCTYIGLRPDGTREYAIPAVLCRFIEFSEAPKSLMRRLLDRLARLLK